MSVCTVGPDDPRAITTEQVLRVQLEQALKELAMLKAAPRLDIVTSGASGPRPYTLLYRFDWRGYRHQTLVSTEWADDRDYTDHVRRTGVEAVVRAVADEQLPRLITTRYTDSEYYRAEKD